MSNKTCEGGNPTLIVHTKVLFGVMAVLVLCMVVRFVFPDLAAVFSTDNIIFVTGMVGLMTIMHMTGYIEGLQKGLRQHSICNNRDCSFWGYGCEDFKDLDCIMKG